MTARFDQAWPADLLEAMRHVGLTREQAIERMWVWVKLRLDVAAHDREFARQTWPDGNWGNG